jgi:hypothetical protein
VIRTHAPFTESINCTHERERERERERWGILCLILSPIYDGSCMDMHVKCTVANVFEEKKKKNSKEKKRIDIPL